MSSKQDNNLIWIDLEMTGLDFSKDRIIEIATIVTDSDLNIIAEGPVLAISQPDLLLDGMDKWNQSQHTQSGLVKRVRESITSEESAEQQTIAFLRQHVSPKKSPMCGNSICTDRRFLYNYMPDLEAYFHYRNLDVSTVKELAKRWYGEALVKGFKKKSLHTALADIQESVEEMKYYRAKMFNVSAA